MKYFFTIPLILIFGDLKCDAISRELINSRHIWREANRLSGVEKLQARKKKLLQEILSFDDNDSREKQFDEVQRLTKQINNGSYLETSPFKSLVYDVLLPNSEPNKNKTNNEMFETTTEKSIQNITAPVFFPQMISNQTEISSTTGKMVMFLNNVNETENSSDLPYIILKNTRNSTHCDNIHCEILKTEASTMNDDPSLNMSTIAKVKLFDMLKQFITDSKDDSKPKRKNSEDDKGEVDQKKSKEKKTSEKSDSSSDKSKETKKDKSEELGLKVKVTRKNKKKKEEDKKDDSTSIEDEDEEIEEEVSEEKTKKKQAKHKPTRRKYNSKKKEPDGKDVIGSIGRKMIGRILQEQLKKAGRRNGDSKSIEQEDSSEVVDEEAEAKEKKKRDKKSRLNDYRIWVLNYDKKKEDNNEEEDDKEENNKEENKQPEIKEVWNEIIKFLKDLGLPVDLLNMLQMRRSGKFPTELLQPYRSYYNLPKVAVPPPWKSYGRLFQSTTAQPFSPMPGKSSFKVTPQMAVFKNSLPQRNPTPYILNNNVPPSSTEYPNNKIKMNIIHQLSNSGQGNWKPTPQSINQKGKTITIVSNKPRIYGTPPTIRNYPVSSSPPYPHQQSGWATPGPYRQWYSGLQENNEQLSSTPNIDDDNDYNEWSSPLVNNENNYNQQSFLSDNQEWDTSLINNGMSNKMDTHNQWSTPGTYYNNQQNSRITVPSNNYEDQDQVISPNPVNNNNISPTVTQSSVQPKNQQYLSNNNPKNFNTQQRSITIVPPPETNNNRESSTPNINKLTVYQSPVQHKNQKLTTDNPIYNSQWTSTPLSTTGKDKSTETVVEITKKPQYHANVDKIEKKESHTTNEKDSKRDININIHIHNNKVDGTSQTTSTTVDSTGPETVLPGIKIFKDESKVQNNENKKSLLTRFLDLKERDSKTTTNDYPVQNTSQNYPSKSQPQDFESKNQNFGHQYDNNSSNWYPENIKQYNQNTKYGSQEYQNINSKPNTSQKQQIHQGPKFGQQAYQQELQDFQNNSQKASSYSPYKKQNQNTDSRLVTKSYTDLPGVPFRPNNNTQRLKKKKLRKSMVEPIPNRFMEKQLPEGRIYKNKPDIVRNLQKVTTPVIITEATPEPEINDFNPDKWNNVNDMRKYFYGNSDLLDDIDLEENSVTPFSANEKFPYEYMFRRIPEKKKDSEAKRFASKLKQFLGYLTNKRNNLNGTDTETTGRLERNMKELYETLNSIEEKNVHQQVDVEPQKINTQDEKLERIEKFLQQLPNIFNSTLVLLKQLSDKVNQMNKPTRTNVEQRNSTREEIRKMKIKKSDLDNFNLTYPTINNSTPIDESFDSYQQISPQNDFIPQYPQLPVNPIFPPGWNGPPNMFTGNPGPGIAPPFVPFYYQNPYQNLFSQHLPEAPRVVSFPVPQVMNAPNYKQPRKNISNYNPTIALDNLNDQVGDVAKENISNIQTSFNKQTNQTDGQSVPGHNSDRARNKSTYNQFPQFNQSVSDQISPKQLLSKPQITSNQFVSHQNFSQNGIRNNQRVNNIPFRNSTSDGSRNLDQTNTRHGHSNFNPQYRQQFSNYMSPQALQQYYRQKQLEYQYKNQSFGHQYNNNHSNWYPGYYNQSTTYNIKPNNHQQQQVYQHVTQRPKFNQQQQAYQHVSHRPNFNQEHDFQNSSQKASFNQQQQEYQHITQKPKFSQQHQHVSQRPNSNQDQRSFQHVPQKTNFNQHQQGYQHATQKPTFSQQQAYQHVNQRPNSNQERFNQQQQGYQQANQRPNHNEEYETEARSYNDSLNSEEQDIEAAILQRLKEIEETSPDDFPPGIERNSPNNQSTITNMPRTGKPTHLTDQSNNPKVHKESATPGIDMLSEYLGSLVTDVPSQMTLGSELDHHKTRRRGLLKSEDQQLSDAEEPAEEEEPLTEAAAENLNKIKQFLKENENQEITPEILEELNNNPFIEIVPCNGTKSTKAENSENISSNNE